MPAENLISFEDLALFWEKDKKSFFHGVHNKKTASDRHFRLFDAVLFYLISSLKAFKMHLKSKKCKSEIYVFIHNRKIRALYAGRFTNNQLFAPRLNKFKNLNYAQTKTVTQFI